MSRRVSKTAVALLAITLVVQTPSAFAVSRDRAENPDSGITRIVQTVKRIVRNLLPQLSEADPITGITTPSPPKP